MSLFSEIAGAQPEQLRESIRGVRMEIIAHLERLCAVRRGSMLLASDYGVTDVTFLFHSFPGGMEGWCEELTQALLRYEPRLREVEVRSLATERLELTFRAEISGALITDGRVVPVQITAKIDPHRGWS